METDMPLGNWALDAHLVYIDAMAEWPAGLKVILDALL